jgi:hypothetical protein
VSPWSAERLRIGLGAGSVELALRAPWPLARVLRSERADFTPRAGEPAWQAALDALAPALEAFGARGHRTAVRLSNRWVRYAVLPWTADVSRTSELEQLARLQFEQRDGDAVAAWTVRLSDGGWGRPFVACAIDTALLDGLRAVLQAHGVQPGSVQPLLMAAYNDCRARLGDSAAFAVVEPDRVCVGVFDGQGWGDIGSRRSGGSAAVALAQELATLAADQAPAALDLLLVGEDTDWHGADDALPEPRVLGRRALALCGGS